MMSMSRFRCRRLALVLSLLLCGVRSAAAVQETATEADQVLLTVAEQSGYTATATYEEVMAFCRQLAETSPQVDLRRLGRSHERRVLPLLIVGQPPAKSPAELRRSGKLPVFIMGNIHAGEVCGKEAILMLAREIARNGNHPLLSDLVLLLAPIYNADGNERFSTENRREQNGPEKGVGQRENAQGLDLNRDHVKLETPEARALAQFISKWDPAILIDTHTTDGSRHRYAITYDSPRHPATPGKIVQFARDEFLPAVGARMSKGSEYASFFYGNFDPDHTRWETYPDWPRYSTHYFGLRGRIGILSEAYAYAPYRDRVLATKQFLLACLEEAAARAKDVKRVLQTARGTLARPREGDENPYRVAIRSKPVPFPEPVQVLGFAEAESEGHATHQPQTYTVDYFGKNEPTLEVTLPFAYLLPPTLQTVVANLAHHGIQLHVLREDVELDIEVYRIDSWKRSEQAFEGHQLVDVTSTVESCRRQVPAGTIVAKTAQTSGALLVNLLEPQAQDGLCTWNFFDDAVEKGGEFPVLRLAAPAPLLLAEYSPPRAGPEARKRVTFDTLFGTKAADFHGSPATGFRWMTDERHFLDYRDNGWYRIDAATGAAQEHFDSKQLTRTLADLPGLDEKSASRLVRRNRYSMDAQQTAAVLTHNNDVYYTRLDGSDAARLTATPQTEELITFSPDGRYLAFVRDYDLYAVDIGRKVVVRLTEGGNRIRRNGKADWVYFEEVYDRNWQGYQWSPDSRWIAFVHFDDSAVRDFLVINPMSPRAEVERERYPKAGDPIPHVRLGVVPATGGPVQWVATDNYSEDNMILTRYGWLPDRKRLYLLVQDRAQRWLDVNLVDLTTGAVTRLFRERTKAWVPDPGKLWFLSDGSFVMRSDRDGWRHLYLHDSHGKLVRPITEGPWEVREVHAVDEEEGWIYFSGTRDSHVATNVYRARLNEPAVERLTDQPGTHAANMSASGEMFIDSHSDHTGPTQVVLRAGDGSLVRTLDINPVADLARYEFGTVELFEIPLTGGYQMPCTLVKPPDFDPHKRYPVWLMTYGGPHAPTVANAWHDGRAYDQMLAEMGVLAFRCDPRCASGQGPRTTWTAYRKLGVQETKDIEEAVDWLVAQPFVDSSRIGMSGYSYGGYLTAYVMTHTKRFAAGIAGGPVTDWRNYDAFYTERYMDTPQENPQGYERSSVIRAASQLHGRLLLIHGGMDDNVHVQNTLQLAHKLQEANVPFEMMIYPTSRHGIHSPHYNRITVDFIRRTMLGEPESNARR
jgi:dipeptidyl aminopeptidase/acylaminoacyl peptidase